MGGPSIIENNYDLSLLSNRDDIIFLESKALTPKFLEYGIVPDYYMMFYPEKSKSNAFQEFVFQSLLANIDLSELNSPEHQ